MTKANGSSKGSVYKFGHAHISSIDYTTNIRAYKKRLAGCRLVLAGSGYLHTNYQLCGIKVNTDEGIPQSVAMPSAEMVE